MSNQVSGITTLLFSSLVYYASYYYKKKDNYSIAILLLMLSGFALRLFASADLFLHPWDEVFHALASKHMIQHPLIPTLYENPILPYDYKNWTGNYIWVHKQPLPLWIMALSMSLFGVNEIALRLPSVILTTIGIWLTFYIGNYFFNKKVGYLAAFFYSINGLIIEMTAGRIPTDHIDDFFLVFVELTIFFSIVFSQKKNFVYNICAGFSLGAAILCKWMPALIVLPVWLLVLVESKKFTIQSIIIHLVILLVITGCVFLPWQIYIYHTFPIEANWEAGYNMKHITQVLDEQGGPVYYYLNKIRINYGELIYIPLIWFVWIALKDFGNLKYLSLLIWVLIPTIFFSLIKTKMQGYILFVCPAIFIISAAFWYTLWDYRNVIQTNEKIEVWKKWFVNLLLLALIVLPVRYGIERVKPFQKDRSPQWVIDLKNMEQRNMEKGILFNYEKSIDAMFYTNLIVYPYTADKKTIENLQQKGYTIIINDDGKAPADILSMGKVVKLHLSLPAH